MFWHQRLKVAVSVPVRFAPVGRAVMERAQVQRRMSPPQEGHAFGAEALRGTMTRIGIERSQAQVPVARAQVGQKPVMPAP